MSFTSDYLFRGQSQTEHAPALQGGIDWTHSLGFYAGMWGSNVRFPDYPDKALEVDVSGGYLWDVTDEMTLSLGAIYYGYFKGSDLNTWEFPLKAKWQDFRAEANYSPNWNGKPYSAWYFSAGWNRKIVWETSAELAVGYSIFDNNLELNNYLDYKVALSRILLDVNFELSARWVSQTQANSNDYSRLVLTVAKSF